MSTSPTKRAINILIFLGLFAFLHQISGPASAHIDRANSAISDIQARGH